MLGVQLSNCLWLWCKVDGRQWNIKFCDVSLSGFFCIQVWWNLKWIALISCTFSQNLPLKVLLRLFLHLIGTFCNIYTDFVVFIFLWRSWFVSDNLLPYPPESIRLNKHRISFLIQTVHNISVKILMCQNVVSTNL